MRYKTITSYSGEIVLLVTAENQDFDYHHSCELNENRLQNRNNRE